MKKCNHNWVIVLDGWVCNKCGLKDYVSAIYTIKR